MINEALKAWGRVPSDEEWHKLFHAKDDPDPKCPLCRKKQREK